jgi:Fic family protein
MALKLEALPNEEIAAVEYGNLLACFDREPELAPRFLADPLGVFAEAHAVVCAGLVAEPGVLRTTAQAIHDGAQGWVVYNAPDPARLSGLMAQLAEWLRDRGGAEHPVVVAGTVQERLLEWQPFEAANGRMARIASRLVLRARGVDPHGVTVPERWLAADPGGYYGEVAATIRRRGDLGRWLERYGEALVAALTAAADAATGEAPDPPARARSICAALAVGEELTVAEYAARAGVGLDDARAHLDELARAGLLDLEPGSQGLRYRRG